MRRTSQYTRGRVQGGASDTAGQVVAATATCPSNSLLLRQMLLQAAELAAHVFKLQASKAAVRLTPVCLRPGQHRPCTQTPQARKRG